MSSHISLVSSWLELFSDFPRFGLSWQFWGVLLRDFVECPSTGIFSEVSLVIRQELCVLESKTTERPGAIFITFYQEYVRSTWLVTDEVPLVTSLRYCLSGFSILMRLFPPSPTAILWSSGGSHCAQPILRDRGVTFHFLGEDLHRLFGILLYRRLDYSRLFFYISMDSWTFILYFELYSKTALFSCSNCPSSGC